MVNLSQQKKEFNKFNRKHRRVHQHRRLMSVKMVSYHPCYLSCCILFKCVRTSLHFPAFLVLLMLSSNNLVLNAQFAENKHPKFGP